MYFVMSTVSVGSFQKQVPLHVDCGSCYGLMLSAALAVLSMNSLEKIIYVTHKVLSKIRSVDHL